MLQPLLLVYVITLVPAETPVTTPALVTVATPGVADTQGLTAAGTPDPVKVVLPPIHVFNVPLIVGTAVTVIISFEVDAAAEQNGVFEIVQVNRYVPGPGGVKVGVVEVVLLS